MPLFLRVWLFLVQLWGITRRGGVGLLFIFGFYGGAFKSINRRLMELCNISFENKDYHEEDRKREEAERERLKNTNRSWFGKFIDRLRL